MASTGASGGPEGVLKDLSGIKGRDGDNRKTSTEPILTHDQQQEASACHQTPEEKFARVTAEVESRTEALNANHATGQFSVYPTKPEDMLTILVGQPAEEFKIDRFDMTTSSECFKTQLLFHDAAEPIRLPGDCVETWRLMSTWFCHGFIGLESMQLAENLEPLVELYHHAKKYEITKLQHEALGYMRSIVGAIDESTALEIIESGELNDYLQSLTKEIKSDISIAKLREDLVQRVEQILIDMEADLFTVLIESGCLGRGMVIGILNSREERRAAVETRMLKKILWVIVGIQVLIRVAWWRTSLFG